MESDYKQQMKELEKQVEGASRNWFMDMCRDPYAAFHLYYIPSAGSTPGKVDIRTAENAQGWTLAHPKRIGGDITREQAARFALDTLQRLPILATV